MKNGRPYFQVVEDGDYAVKNELLTYNELYRIRSMAFGREPIVKRVNAKNTYFVFGARFAELENIKDIRKMAVYDYKVTIELNGIIIKTNTVFGACIEEARVAAQRIKKCLPICPHESKVTVKRIK